MLFHLTRWTFKDIPLQQGLKTTVFQRERPTGSTEVMPWKKRDWLSLLVSPTTPLGLCERPTLIYIYSGEAWRQDSKKDVCAHPWSKAGEAYAPPALEAFKSFPVLYMSNSCRPLLSHGHWNKFSWSHMHSSLQGQHLDRTLLENHQAGMGLSQSRRYGGRASKWNRQLHQVLQLQASTPVHRWIAAQYEIRNHCVMKKTCPNACTCKFDCISLQHRDKKRDGSCRMRF